MEHTFGWFEWAGEKLGLHISSSNVHMVASGTVFVFLVIVSMTIWRRARNALGCVVPTERCSLFNAFDVIVDAVAGMMEDIIGPTARQHVPLIGTIFIYVLFSNLMGAIPGVNPPTANMNTNLAVAAVVFVYYNYVGIRTQGIGNYLKHLMGPVIWVAPLLFAIELFSHIIRPMTLSIRLFCNMVADHAVVGVFSSLVPLVIPVVFMALGLFIAFLQAFVFSLLSVVYIALATAQEEH